MNCMIRKWKLTDAKDIAVVLSSKKIHDNLRDGLPYPYTEQDGIDFISSMLSANEDETFAFAITLDDKVIGSIGVFRQKNIHRQTAEMGYYIAEAYWGKGIVTDAVKQICEYVVRNTDILRIHADRRNNRVCVPWQSVPPLHPAANRFWRRTEPSRAYIRSENPD